LGLAERAVRIAALGQVEPAKRGRARLVLARALWQATDRRDLARARQMAELARKDFSEDGRASEALAEAEAWLAAHPAPR
jgi:hypothetical protein